jgi:hypothetical protein
MIAFREERCTQYIYNFRRQKGHLSRSTWLSIYSSAIGTIFNFQRAESLEPRQSAAWIRSVMMVICAFSLRAVVSQNLPSLFAETILRQPKNRMQPVEHCALRGFRSINQENHHRKADAPRSESRTQCYMGIIYRFFLTHLISFTAC